MTQKNSNSNGPEAISQLPHRRFNPLIGEWVLVSPQRGDRPWQGATESSFIPTAPAHDPSCYLCAGNTRVSGGSNPNYTGPYVFQNDFPALLSESLNPQELSDPLFQVAPATGEARVMCFSERHDLPMARLPLDAVKAVIECWISQYKALSEKYEWVAVFENKGAAMWCSNPHPHGQIWASDFVPSVVECEDHHQKEYLGKTGSPLLLDYVKQEEERGDRTVVSSDHWLVVVPHWAVWPFETLLLPRAQVSRLSDLSQDQIDDLACVLKSLTTKYDNLFETDFPYSMGWHGAPTAQADSEHWQLHAHYYPPLLRSASVKKFMVGNEILAEAQRDITPETAAALLRAQPETHYLEQSGAKNER